MLDLSILAKEGSIMFQNGLAGQILFLLVTGFSLLIVVINHCFNYQDGPLRRAGPLFLSPLLVFVFLYLGPPALTAEALFISAETIVIAGLLILLSTPSEGFPTRPFTISLCILPFLLIGLSWLPVWGPLLPALNHYLIYVNMALLVIALIQSQRRFKSASLLTLAMFSILAAQPLALLPDSPPARIAYVSLLGLGLGSFFLYFYDKIHKNINNRIDEADRLFLEWDKSVKYEVLRRTIDFEHARQKLLDINKIDGLAKCYNKNAILEIIAQLIQKEHSFTLLMMDVDKFKEINDTLGHLIGDQILVQVAAIIQDSIREVDSLGRWGGDEFILALPRTGVRDAIYTAERIRQNIAGRSDLDVTLSIGVAAFPEDGDSVEQLVEFADTGLYLSKQRGRNTVSHAAELVKP